VSLFFFSLSLLALSQVPMWRTNVANEAVGPFGGNLVVSMRPYVDGGSRWEVVGGGGRWWEVAEGGGGRGGGGRGAERVDVERGRGERRAEVGEVER
jgi:hypothetical protein